MKPVDRRGFVEPREESVDVHTCHDDFGDQELDVQLELEEPLLLQRKTQINLVLRVRLNKYLLRISQFSSRAIQIIRDTIGGGQWGVFNKVTLELFCLLF